MKYTQYCSVCKNKFEMDVITTDDDEDDGVLWLRCPQCQGFLPRLNSMADDDTPESKVDTTTADADAAPASGVETDAAAEPVAETDIPSVMDFVETPPASEPLPADADTSPKPDRDLDELLAGSADEDAKPATGEKDKKPEPPPEDYTAELAAMDVTLAKPYRPWNSYAIGDVVHHLAWDDCGVVVGEEVLPGNRKVIKVAFEKTGVHKLIVESPRS